MELLVTNQDLEDALERARQHEITPEELRAQRISFAYGNLALHNPAITKEMVEKVAEELYGPITQADGYSG